jgi:hypothetical protein
MILILLVKKRPRSLPLRALVMLMMGMEMPLPQIVQMALPMATL